MIIVIEFGRSIFKGFVWYCLEIANLIAYHLSFVPGDWPTHGLSGACAAIIRDRMYMFGGFMERSGHTSDVFSLNLKNLTFKNHTDSIKGQSPARKDKLCCWSYKNKLILFGGFGEAPEFSSNSSDFVFEVKDA